MKIVDHWLDTATRITLPGRGNMPTRRFLVQHATEGWADGVEVMRSRNVSAHFLIQRDGQIIQCVPCNQIAYHAGRSQWRDPNTGKMYDGLKSCSIGIKHANIMDLERENYPSTMGAMAGKPIPRVTINGKKWEIYTEAQLAASEALSKVLVEHYHLDDIVGHRDISPGRKSDPGDAYPLARIRQVCGFTKPLAHL